VLGWGGGLSQGGENGEGKGAGEESSLHAESVYGDAVTVVHLRECFKGELLEAMGEGVADLSFGVSGAILTRPGSC